MFDPFHVLPHPSYWLENLSPHRFEAVARGLREILVLRDDDDLVLDDELGICVVANGMTTPIDRLSDGYKSIFATAVDIIRSLLSRSDNLESARAVVLIDEIETHLHPQWKMRVVSALRRAMPRVQFIATTHDPLCLRGMNDGEVAVLVRSEAAIEVLSDLPDVRGMRVDQLLTSDYFGLNSTADPDVELELAKLADRASTFDLVESDPTQLSLANSIVLGEGPEDQIAAEALQQYLNLRRSSSSAGRTDARKRAVDAFLAAIGRRTGG